MHLLSVSPARSHVVQAKDELDRLIQREYWLKYDFTGCVRKLLPAQQQALCMVSAVVGRGAEWEAPLVACACCCRTGAGQHRPEAVPA